jgi:glycerol-3-phosphate acyltransferase PlsY
MAVSDWFIALAGYLAGSIPSAYLFARAFSGRDVRYEGNRNVGTRNAARLGGRRAGLLTALADMLKGAAVWFLCWRWGSGALSYWVGGVTLMLGHAFPVWLGFRGGKGLGAAGGFFLPMFPLSMLAAAALTAVLYAGRATIRLLNVLGPLAFLAATYFEGKSLSRTSLVLALGAMAGAKSVLDLALLRRQGRLSGWAERPRDGPVWRAQREAEPMEKDTATGNYPPS